MRRYKLIITYDGTAYAGWQVQPRGQAIAPLIQRGIETILRHSISFTGSGRTDAGVHALGQVADFSTTQILTGKNFLYQLNSILPPDIRVLDLQEVPLDFHSRYSALEKTYRYQLDTHPYPSPFSRSYAWALRAPLDLSLMREAASFLEGTYDFKAFSNASSEGTASYDSVRHLKKIQIEEENSLLSVEVTAEGFLYKMVRNMVGSLVEVGTKKRSPSDLKSALESRDRKKLGICAPPHGLFLKRVLYPSFSS